MTDPSESNKSHERSASESSNKEEKLSLDFSIFKKWFSGSNFSGNKTTAILLTTLLILIPVILTFYTRLLPEQLPQTEMWAMASVENFYKNQIASTVNQQYPNLPQANKDQLILQQFEEFKKTNSATMNQQAKEASTYFKSGFQYKENNHTYTFLGDLDSYFYLRQAENVREKGMVCDVIKDGRCWDDHLLAPLGGPVTANLHPYGTVVLYNILHFFDNSMNLMRAAFLLPTVLAAIACVAAFFIGRRLMNEVAGFFASMLVALNPMLITRTLGSDTDIWNITLPLIIIWIFLESFEAKNLWTKCILSAIAGLFMGIFAFAWGGWWYVFLFTIISVLMYFTATIVKNYIEHRKVAKVFTVELRNDLIILGVLFVSTAIFVSLMLSFETFLGIFTAPFSTLSALKSAVQADLWPNVFTTVAELNEANIATVVSQTAFGVTWLFALALLGIVLTMVNRNPSLKEYVLLALSALIYLYLVSPAGNALSTNMFIVLMLLPVVAAGILFLLDKKTKVDIKSAFLFIIWFVVMVAASVKGVRFILLLTPIFAIAVGVAVGYFFQYLSRLFKSELKINETVSHLLVFAVLCLILITPVKAGIAAGEGFTPSMTLGWWDSLLKIKSESQPDAIINSWWDFGHWFKYVADRRVTLDGVTQNHPNAHWLGLILQTKSEREALGILRMLDCGSNSAFDEVNKKVQDTEVAENIVSRLVEVSKKDGESYLKTLGFSSQEIAAISQYTYCSPPEDYFITSEDMVGKAGVWAHFGLWNFDRAYMVNEILLKQLSLEESTKILIERFNFTSAQATSTYYELQSLQTDREMNDWVAPWPGYFVGDWIGGCKQPAAQTTVLNSSNETVMVIPSALLCPINAVIAQDANGRNILEGAIYDYSNPMNSTLLVTGYNAAGARIGSARANPAAFVLMGPDSSTKIKMENVSFPYDIIIDTVNNRTLLASPELSESLFTQLFFLDGRHNEGFQKFSDITDLTGQRIIVWKVNWTAIDEIDNQ